MRDRIVFWFITPPNNMKSIVESFCNYWYGSVRLISLHDVTEERKKVGWNARLNARVELEILDNMPNPDLCGENILKAEIESIHIFCGFSKGPGKYLHYYNKLVGKQGSAFVISEPKSLVGSTTKIALKKLFGELYYRFERLEVQKCVKGLFITGLAGINQYRRYGWNENYIFNFMYTPYYNDGTANAKNIFSDVGKNIRFLYIGRFNYYTRGLDTLMKAVEGLSVKANWMLTLVGGYGENASQVIEWANKSKRVEYVGSWNPETVHQRMVDYDVYICPTNIDGWNTQINEALLANMGIITTDAAGSDELVLASGAGIVVHKGDSGALRKAMEQCINNPNVVNEWKRRANQYREMIHPNVVSKYMIECIEYTMRKEMQKPICPWLTGIEGRQ